jgi:hypothetical protein
VAAVGDARLAERNARLSRVGGIGSSIPLDGERARSYWEVGEAASNGLEQSIRVRAVRVEDDLPAAELVSVVFSPKRRCRFGQPVFECEDGLALLRRSVGVVRQREVSDDGLGVRWCIRLLLSPEKTHVEMLRRLIPSSWLPECLHA